LPKLRQADGSRQIDKAISVLTAVALPVITHTSAPKSGYPYSAPILSLKLAAAASLAISRHLLWICLLRILRRSAG
jgi:hypothetical protein